MARRKAQNPYGSCLAARGRLPARKSRRFRHRALLSSGPSRSECADRSVSQLLAGTPSGPGGSFDAARVPRCDEARRRRTPSRLTTPHETPLTGRGEGIISEVWNAGIVRGTAHRSRHPGGSRDPGATGTERAALDTGFRRYDGARCLLGERQSPLPRGESVELAAALRQTSALNNGLRRYLCPRRTTTCYD